MRVLGVDLSMAQCGLSVVEATSKSSATDALHFVATVRPKKGHAPASKRAEILRAVKALHKQYGFGVIVMEQVRLFSFGKINLATIAAIVSLSTTIEDWAHTEGVKPVVKVAVNSWRKVVLGHGRPENPKQVAIRYVKSKYGKELKDDAAEAVCLAEYGLRTWSNGKGSASED